MNQGTERGASRLKKWRCEIDRLDNELLRLLNHRARVACELGVVKIASGLPAYDRRRERQVLSRIRGRNQGPLSQESVNKIFRRVILETRRIGIESMRQQRRKSLAVRRLGKEHSNGH
ncbi:MAG TPA: chorismate mutase [Terriglobia bacterium]